MQLLRAENNRLKLDVSKRDVELAIERNTLVEMNNTLLQQQSEIVEQQLALRFSQKVMAPEDTANGLRIEEVNLEAGVSADHYRFELLVAQLEKRKNYIRGEAELSVVGSEQGHLKTIALKKLLTTGHDLKFSFRYFQSIKGEFTLSLNFIPEQLQITLKMSRRRAQKAAAMTEVFPWKDIIIIPLRPLVGSAE